MNGRHPFQRGFAIIAALFLVVVLAALGAFMVSFSNTQHLTSAQDVQGSRAYWAARAGLEWGIVSAVSACPASPTSLAVDVFTVTVTCAQSTYSDSDTVNMFSITAVANVTGSSVGGIGYIERSVSASVCRLQSTPYGFC
jgi:MSHA biogenesis protein MshP